MKATLANAYTTAPASPLCLLSCISDCLSDLCISKGLLLLSGHDLDALSTRNLRQLRRTVVPVTVGKPLRDGVLTLKRLGLNLYPQAWPRIQQLN
jgi:hypothetical protein